MDNIDFGWVDWETSHDCKHSVWKFTSNVVKGQLPQLNDLGVSFGQLSPKSTIKPYSNQWTKVALAGLIALLIPASAIAKKVMMTIYPLRPPRYIYNGTTFYSGSNENAQTHPCGKI